VEVKIWLGLVVVRIVKFRRLQWAGHVATMRDTRNAYRIVVEKSLEKLKIGRP
jgi:hypothetical protein